MKYHGNYCGPNWSAGKIQPSVDSDMPGIDEFDETCRNHDAAYARGDDLVDADFQFFRKNFGRGSKRTAAAAAVGVQGLFRAVDKYFPQVYPTTQMSSPNLRGSQKPKKHEKEPPSGSSQ